MLNWFKRNIWTDPVWSNVIANGIIFSIGYLFYRLKSFDSSGSVKNEPNNAFSQIMNKLFDFLKTENGQYLSYGIFGILGLLFIWNLIKLIRVSIYRIKLSRFSKGFIWGALIKWKWERNNGDWRIVYGDYEKICPRCSHNLKFDENNGHYYLTCSNLNCNFRSGVYHIEPPSVVAVYGIDFNTLYFHQALESSVYAELRSRGLKD
jgi:hypothetical protein